MLFRSNYEWHSFSAEYVDYFRIKMLEGAFKKDPTFIKTHQDDLQSRILNDGGSVAGQIGIGFPMLILNLFRIVFVLFVMSRMSMLLSVIVLTVVPIYTGFFQGVTQKARDNSRKEREAFSSLNSSLEENLNGIFQIKIFQKESFFLDRFKRQTLDYEKYIKAIRRFTSYSYGIGEMITTILPIITLSIGAIEVANGQMTMGNLFAFYFYLNFLYEPMNNLADYFTSLQVTFGVADRVMELMELCPLRLS